MGPGQHADAASWAVEDDDLASLGEEPIGQRGMVPERWRSVDWRRRWRGCPGRSWCSPRRSRSGGNPIRPTCRPSHTRTAVLLRRGRGPTLTAGPTYIPPTLGAVRSYGWGSDNGPLSDLPAPNQLRRADCSGDAGLPPGVTVPGHRVLGRPGRSELLRAPSAKLYKSAHRIRENQETGHHWSGSGGLLT